MSTRQSNDILLNHPEFAVIGDATSLVDPSVDAFSSWLFERQSPATDTPSIFEQTDDASAPSNLDALVADEALFSFQFNDLEGSADLLTPVDDSTSATYIDLASYGTGSGDSAKIGLPHPADCLVNTQSLFDPSQHQDSTLLDHSYGVEWLTSFIFNGDNGWVSPMAAANLDASSDVFSSSNADITMIDTEFFAKGGNPGGPGGGGGKGGGGGGSGSGGGDTSAVAEYSAGSADGDAGYDILIDFKGDGWTAILQDAFIQAANYFTTVITQDIGGGGRYHGTIIDDLYVVAELTSIDGAGGILGQAGPTAVWTATELTAAGQMQFDLADAQNYFDQGLWNDIVTHEFMHVLGFGSLWNYGDNQLVLGNGYTGTYGLEAYRELVDSSAEFIPVEDGGGSGTAGSHWDEQALGNELMTGYINDTNYLSQFSVVSLADLGYQVEYQTYSGGLLIA